MSKKGLELPVNMIVVVTVAVLVLVVVAAFLITNFSNNAGIIDLNSALASGCSNLRAFYGCSPDGVGQVMISQYKEPGTNKQCNLGNICAKSGITDSKLCAKYCGCEVETGAGATLKSACTGRQDVTPTMPSANIPPPPPF